MSKDQEQTIVGSSQVQTNIGPSTDVKLPEACLLCLKKTENDEVLDPLDVINCTEIGFVPVDQIKAIPCSTASTHVGGAGKFLTPEEKFNNRGSDKVLFEHLPAASLRSSNRSRRIPRVGGSQ
jgi:hypothetical protein